MTQRSLNHLGVPVKNAFQLASFLINEYVNVNPVSFSTTLIDNCWLSGMVAERKQQELQVRLSNSLIHSVKKSGVKIFFASRNTTKVWNSSRLSGEPMRYGGWYWMRTQRGRVTAMDEDGPFRTQSAAIRDAFVKLQLR